MQETVLISCGLVLLGFVLGYMIAKRRHKKMSASNLLEMENLLLRERLHEMSTTVHWTENVDAERNPHKRRLSDKILASQTCEERPLHRS